MNKDLLSAADQKFQKTLEFLQEDLKTIRSGRASPALVEGVTVKVYEQPLNLKQLASISTPDARTIAISPWDKSQLGAIEKALREDQSLDLNPVSDGSAIHLNLPPLTTERREQLVKQVGEKAEQCQISLRTIRHELLAQAKERQKAGELSQDDYHQLDKQFTAKIDEVKQRVDELTASKRQELREI